MVNQADIIQASEHGPHLPVATVANGPEGEDMEGEHTRLTRCPALAAQPPSVCVCVCVCVCGREARVAEEHTPALSPHPLAVDKTEDGDDRGDEEGLQGEYSWTIDSFLKMKQQKLYSPVFQSGQYNWCARSRSSHSPLEPESPVSPREPEHVGDQLPHVLGPAPFHDTTVRCR